jgi:hypothetical protein
MSLAMTEPNKNTSGVTASLSHQLEEGAEPLAPWARVLALVLGVVATGLGTFAVFVSANQAGTALLLVVGVVLLLIGLQGTPLRRFGSGEHSFELLAIRRRLADAVDRAAREESPDVAAAVAEAARTADPGAPVRPAWQIYEESVQRAIQRVGGTVETNYQYGRGRVIDARVTLPQGRLSVEIRHRSRGAFGATDVAAASGQLLAAGLEGGNLVITNAPLSAESQKHNFEGAPEKGSVEVVTWNDERDDHVLARALLRNAR